MSTPALSAKINFHRRRGRRRRYARTSAPPTPRRPASAGSGRTASPEPMCLTGFRSTSGTALRAPRCRAAADVHPHAGADDVLDQRRHQVAWEYRLANGRYQVTVGVGDPNLGADPEKHVINVEGVRAVDEYPCDHRCCTAGTSSSNRLKTSTVWATVTDGKLTVDAVGGINTKLAFVTIDSASVADLIAAPGHHFVDLDWSDVAGATAYRVWRSTNLPVPPPAPRSPPPPTRPSATVPPRRAPSTTTRSPPGPPPAPRSSAR